MPNFGSADAYFSPLFESWWLQAVAIAIAVFYSMSLYSSKPLLYIVAPLTLAKSLVCEFLYLECGALGKLSALCTHIYFYRLGTIAWRCFNLTQLFALKYNYRWRFESFVCLILQVKGLIQVSKVSTGSIRYYYCYYTISDGCRILNKVFISLRISNQSSQ